MQSGKLKFFGQNKDIDTDIYIYLAFWLTVQSSGFSAPWTDSTVVPSAKCCHRIEMF